MYFLKQTLTRRNSFDFHNLLKAILWLLLLGILTIMFFLQQGTFTTQPIFAALSSVEAPERIVYRSEQTLKARSGNSWQVILFKNVYPNRVNSLELRLLGCSSAAKLIHSHPLLVTTSANKVLTAKDVFLEDAPAPTIGQYNFEEILPQLPIEPLLISLPLGGQSFIDIEVPAAVVQEWHEIGAKTLS